MGGNAPCTGEMRNESENMKGGGGYNLGDLDEDS
jgi:hypothetical protein